MGISLLTALAIQENRTEVALYNENGKFGFYIYSVIDSNHRQQISSQPIYDSAKMAKKEGQKLLDEIKSLDLNKKRTELSNLLGDAAEPVMKIISASKS